MKPARRPTDIEIFAGRRGIHPRLSDLERRMVSGNAIVTIAAHNSARRDQADYQCTGSSDQNTLGEAYADGYSHFLLLPGDFHFDAGFDATAFGSERPYSIRGHGDGTIIHVNTPAYDAAFYETNLDWGVSYRDLTFSLENAGAAAIYTAGDHPQPTLIENVFIYSDTFGGTLPDTAGIYLAGSRARLSNVVFGGCNIKWGIYAAIAEVTMDHVIADGGYNTITGSDNFDGDTFIYVAGDRCQIVNSRIEGVACSGTGDLSTAIFWAGDDGLLGTSIVINTVGTYDVVDSSGSGLREVGNLVGNETSV